MAKKQTKLQKKDDSRLFAFLAAFLTIIGFIIALIVKRDDEYVMHYAKQGLVLFILQLITWALNGIPVIGWIVTLGFIILWIMAWINALSGEKRHTFLVSEFSNKIRL